jgi:hypothetical protein
MRGRIGRGRVGVGTAPQSIDPQQPEDPLVILFVGQLNGGPERPRQAVLVR